MPALNFSMYPIADSISMMSKIARHPSIATVSTMKDAIMMIVRFISCLPARAQIWPLVDAHLYVNLKRIYTCFQARDTMET